MLCKKCKKEIDDDSVYCKSCGAKQIVVSTHKPKSRGNGTGSVYKLPSGKYKAEIVIGYYKQDGKLKKRRKTRTFVKKSDALNAISDLRKEKQIQTSPTLFDLHEAFLKTKRYDKLGKSQKDKLSYAWNRCKEIQLSRISDLTLFDMQSAIDKNTSTFYPARDMKVLLSHLFTTAIQQGVETVNRTEYIELPDAPNAKRQVFSEIDLAKFWDDYYGQTPDGATEAHKFTGYILIMIYTGMRIGELYKIKKSDIHLKKRYMIGGEKSEAGIDREIPISKSIIKVLTDFYSSGDKKLVERNIWGFYDEYWETIERLGIEKYPPHTCRHTYFTMLVQQDVHPAVIASMGGHAQYQTAIDHYNRLPLSEKISAADKL